MRQTTHDWRWTIFAWTGHEWARTERRPTTERENGRRDERETGAELYLRQEIIHARRRGARLTDVGGVRERGDPSAAFPRKSHRPRSPSSSETVAAANSCAAAVVIFLPLSIFNRLIYLYTETNYFITSFSPWHSDIQTTRHHLSAICTYIKLFLQDNFLFFFNISSKYYLFRPLISMITILMAICTRI